MDQFYKLTDIFPQQCKNSWLSLETVRYAVRTAPFYYSCCFLWSRKVTLQRAELDKCHFDSWGRRNWGKEKRKEEEC